MYSPVDKYPNSAILSFKEMLGVIVVFSFVLYLLFPKGDIEQLFEGKNEHTNLSINYLESMLLYYPENVKLQLLLIKKYDFIGATEKALLLNEKLIEKTTDKSLLTQLYKTQYLLEKDIYYRTEDKEVLKRLKKRLLAYFEFTKKHRDYLFFFAESTNIDYKALKYKALTGFMQQRPDLIDYEIEKMSYRLASYLNYKEEAYKKLIKLLKYPEISEELRDYALNSLIEHHAYEEAGRRIHQLFLHAKDEDELTKFFYLDLYALGLSPKRELGSIRQLIQEYSDKKELYDNDIYFILNTLLQQGHTQDAQSFAMEQFHKNAEIFDEPIIELALNACTYSAKLKPALTLALFAHNKFKEQSYLDKSIQLSLWLGKSKKAVELNHKGYLLYGDNKYEQYLLRETTLDNAYAILGSLYRKKIEEGDYSFVDNMAEYYEYTGEIPQGEAYFNRQLKKTPQKRLHRYAILFSFFNNHFKKGVQLYEKYRRKYGRDNKLQEESIKAFIVLKDFTQAYALAQNMKATHSEKKKKMLIDLANNEKDYNYLYKKLFKQEKKNQLTENEYYELIQLERFLNKGEKLSYLYHKAWIKSGKTYMLISQLYRLLEEKNFTAFKKEIDDLSPQTKKELYGNIEYLSLLNNYYSHTKQIKKALNNYRKIFKITSKKENHQNYLWFLMDNHLKDLLQKELTFLKEQPQLRKEIGFTAVIAALSLQEKKLAHYWLSPLLLNEPRNLEYKNLYNQMLVQEEQELYQIYDKMQSTAYTNTETIFKQKRISSTFTRREERINYRWLHYKNISSTLSLSDILYTDSPHDGHHKQVALSIKNSKKSLLWKLDIEGNQKVDDFMGASLTFDYVLGQTSMHLQTKYQNSTQLTPKLELTAMESSINIAVHQHIGQHLLLGASFTKSEFKEQNGHYLGEMEQRQLTANYILRQGYPNINFGAYLNDNHFTKNIARDFIELGTEINIGTNAQKLMNRSWKPFGTARLSIDDSNHMGTSLSVGISETLNGSDLLGITFDYSKGIGVINQPTYGIALNYKF